MTLRRRLAVGVAAIVMGTLAVAFVAVYAGTGDQVLTQLDGDLRADMDAYARAVSSGPDPGTRGGVQAAVAYVTSQPYRTISRLLYALPGAGPPVSNAPQLLHGGGAHGAGGPARAIVPSVPGFQDVKLPGPLDVRLLVRRVRTADGTLTLGVGESRRFVDRAQHGVARSFGLAALLALGGALGGAVALSTGIAGPLRRMAGLAARVQEGDLTPRMTLRSGAPAVHRPARRGRMLLTGPTSEVAVLARAFDSMLDRLQAAFDRQSAFVADASHELRTPLTVIRGQLEVLARQAAPPAEEVRRVEVLVRTEVERMNRMVEDLLVLAHAGERDFVRPSVIDLRPFADELVELQSHTAADRTFRLGEIPAGTLRADPDRLAQAVRNLLRNAVEHTQSGATIVLWATPDGSGGVAIGVDDDGPGIPELDRALIFDRFHRAGAHGPRPGGTGLGLAIVQAIAVAHGGQAWAQAAPQGGARVAVALPHFVASAPAG